MRAVAPTRSDGNGNGYLVHLSGGEGGGADGNGDGCLCHVVDQATRQNNEQAELHLN